jgi:hypothetical protein
LAAWLVAFQFEGSQEFFSIDIADYVPALGSGGLAVYRAKLADIVGSLPALTDEQEQSLFKQEYADRTRGGATPNTGTPGSASNTTPADSPRWTVRSRRSCWPLAPSGR